MLCLVAQLFLSTSRPVSGQAAGTVFVRVCSHISMCVHMQVWQEMEEREGE